MTRSKRSKSRFKWLILSLCSSQWMCVFENPKKNIWHCVFIFKSNLKLMWICMFVCLVLYVPMNASECVCAHIHAPRTCWKLCEQICIDGAKKNENSSILLVKWYWWWIMKICFFQIKFCERMSIDKTC